MPEPETVAVDWTVGAIARAAGVAIHRVEYVIRARRMQPIRRAGAYRVFSDESAAAVIEAIRQADEAKGGATR